VISYRATVQSWICESRVKVELFLYLMSWAQRHEDVYRSGGIDVRIRVLGTRWRWVVIFMPSSLYFKEKVRVTHCVGGWVTPEPSGCCGEEINLSSPVGNRTPIRSQLYHELSRLETLHKLIWWLLGSFLPCSTSVPCKTVMRDINLENSDFLLGWPLTLKMEVIQSSETSV
jgi:hypothetical protein